MPNHFVLFIHIIRVNYGANDDHHWNRKQEPAAQSLLRDSDGRLRGSVLCLRHCHNAGVCCGALFYQVRHRRTATGVQWWRKFFWRGKIINVCSFLGITMWQTIAHTKNVYLFQDNLLPQKARLVRPAAKGCDIEIPPHAFSGFSFIKLFSSWNLKSKFSNEIILTVKKKSYWHAIAGLVRKIQCSIQFCCFFFFFQNKA